MFQISIKQLALKYRFNRLKLTTIHNGIADVPAVKQTLKSQSHNNIGEVVGMLPNKQDLQINAPTKHQFVMIKICLSKIATKYNRGNRDIEIT